MFLSSIWLSQHLSHKVLSLGSKLVRPSDRTLWQDLVAWTCDNLSRITVWVVVIWPIECEWMITCKIMLNPWIEHTVFGATDIYFLVVSSLSILAHWLITENNIMLKLKRSFPDLLGNSMVYPLSLVLPLPTSTPPLILLFLLNPLLLHLLLLLLKTRHI